MTKLYKFVTDFLNSKKFLKIGNPPRPQEVEGRECCLSLFSRTPRSRTINIYRHPPLVGEHADTWAVATSFGPNGEMYTDAWVVISGQHQETPDESGHFPVRYPCGDNFMLGIWGDVDGPTTVFRPSSLPNAYLWVGLSPSGKYVVSAEGDGSLRWGVGTRAQMDTFLRRKYPHTLETENLKINSLQTNIDSGGSIELKDYHHTYLVEKEGSVITLPEALSGKIIVVGIIIDGETVVKDKQNNEVYVLKNKQFITLQAYKDKWYVINKT